MSFKQPTLRARRAFFTTDAATRAFFTDENGNTISNARYFGTGAFDPRLRQINDANREYYSRDAAADPDDCDCAEARDAGRIRFAKTPESNHYGGGEFRDDSNPSDFLQPDDADPRNNSNLRPGSRPPEYTHREVTPPNYTGMRAGAPRATQSNPGKLGTGPVEAPWTNSRSVGLGGSAAYDPRTNLSTVGRDPDLMYSTSAKSVGGLKSDGMGSRATDDDKRRLRAINRHNRKFYGLDADPDNDFDPDAEDEAARQAAAEQQQQQEEGPAVTRHTQENPDGSKVVHTQEVHLPRVNTVDPMLPRRQPQLPGTHDNAAKQYGTLRADTVRRGVNTIAEINRLNREKWGK